MQPYDGLALIKAHHGLMAVIADALGISRSGPPKWDKVPAELLPAVERISGIPRWALRPDICPPPAPYDYPATTYQPPPKARRSRVAVDETAEPAEPAVTEAA